MDSSKLKYVSFGTNFIHLSLSLLMRGHNLENLSTGSKFALSATCKLENIVSKQSHLMAALTSTLCASVLCSQKIRLLGTEILPLRKIIPGKHLNSELVKPRFTSLLAVYKLEFMTVSSMTSSSRKSSRISVGVLISVKKSFGGSVTTCYGLCS